jgi:hypothetical protein
VPDGFPGSSLPVPHLTAGQLYMRLRDDPTVLSMAKLTPQSLSPSADELARADTRHAAATPGEHDNAVAAAAPTPLAAPPLDASVPPAVPATPTTVAHPR